MQDPDRRRKSFLERIDEQAEVPLTFLHERFPKASRQVGNVLERLARTGVLQRTETTSGEVVYSLANPADLRHLRRLFVKEFDEDLDDWRKSADSESNLRPYRVGASVYITLAGLFVVIVILTQGFFWPALIAGSVLYLVSRNKRGRGYSSGAGGQPSPGTRSEGMPDDLIQRAKHLRDRIVQSWRSSSRAQSVLPDDPGPAVDRLIVQMEELRSRAGDISWILDSTNPDIMRAKIEELQQQVRDPDATDSIQAEIEKLKKQVESYADLKEQSAAIDRRLGTADASLQRLVLILANVGTAEPNETAKLLHYIDDIAGELAAYREQLDTRYFDRDS